MAQANNRTAAKQAANDKAVVEIPRSVQIASSGIRNDRHAGEYLSALLGDMMADKVSVRVGNACNNTMGKLLKLVELRQKYGSPENSKAIELVPPEPANASRREKLLQELSELDASDDVVNETAGAAR